MGGTPFLVKPLWAAPAPSPGRQQHRKDTRRRSIPAGRLHSLGCYGGGGGPREANLCRIRKIQPLGLPSSSRMKRTLPRHWSVPTRRFRAHANWPCRAFSGRHCATAELGVICPLIRSLPKQDQVSGPRRAAWRWGCTPHETGTPLRAPQKRQLGFGSLPEVQTPSASCRRRFTNPDAGRVSRRTGAQFSSGLGAQHPDMLAIHGLRTFRAPGARPCSRWLPGGGQRVCSKQAGIGSIGFSTHAPAPEFLRRSNRMPSITSICTGISSAQQNGPAIDAPVPTTMGLFVISPTDKRGHLHQPFPYAAVERTLCAVATDSCSTICFCLFAQESTRSSVGACRPADLDLPRSRGVAAAGSSPVLPLAGRSWSAWSNARAETLRRRLAGELVQGLGRKWPTRRLASTCQVLAALGPQYCWRPGISGRARVRAGRAMACWAPAPRVDADHPAPPSDPRAGAPASSPRAKLALFVDCAPRFAIFYNGVS